MYNVYIYCNLWSTNFLILCAISIGCYETDFAVIFIYIPKFVHMNCMPEVYYWYSN